MEDKVIGGVKVKEWRHHLWGYSNHQELGQEWFRVSDNEKGINLLGTSKRDRGFADKHNQELEGLGKVGGIMTRKET